jgi:hypothetical protein
MTTQGQGPQQGKLPPFMFVSKIAKISNDYILYQHTKGNVA